MTEKFKIVPQIKNNISISSHPDGCFKYIENIKNRIKKEKWQEDKDKNILILGGSSGFGLAIRSVFNFGLCAKTINVCFESPPKEGKRTGSAGWYNNIAFNKFACNQNIDIIGDAFSQEIKEKVAKTIKEEFKGQIDIVIFSLATGVRINERGEKVVSSIKTLGEPYLCEHYDIMQETFSFLEVQAATEKEIQDTNYVMGGSGWKQWIDFLLEENLLAKKAKTISFSYLGTKVNERLYHKGTLGLAKEDLHQNAKEIHQKLQEEIQGEADIAVCKVLTTKASVFIPGITKYMLAIDKVLSDIDKNEDIVDQMKRLINDKNFGYENVVRDEKGFIRLDEYELQEDVVKKTQELYEKLDKDNYLNITNPKNLQKQFLEINGFGLKDVDYEKEYSFDDLFNFKK